MIMTREMKLYKTWKRSKRYVFLKISLQKRGFEIKEDCGKGKIKWRMVMGLS